MEHLLSLHGLACWAWDPASWLELDGFRAKPIGLFDSLRLYDRSIRRTPGPIDRLKACDGAHGGSGDPGVIPALSLRDGHTDGWQSPWILDHETHSTANDGRSKFERERCFFGFWFYFWARPEVVYGLHGTGRPKRLRDFNKMPQRHHWTPPGFPWPAESCAVLCTGFASSTTIVIGGS